MDSTSAEVVCYMVFGNKPCMSYGSSHNQHRPGWKEDDGNGGAQQEFRTSNLKNLLRRWIDNVSSGLVTQFKSCSVGKCSGNYS